ncbi:hypothetical protein MLC59_02150 [Marinobacter bryozoorum]|uniref:hypothetical protein n=1 Tax=Marinobacter bryozoorum TaxID=256324 RepID=UPI0020062C07|nr:hypothetical protein [Marinobacter bryozoorum]MCK7542972.1 hypothetical protein [Marinobacter bryozoorum]
MLDLEKFRKADFKPRDTDVSLDALKEAGFGDGVVKLRGLTAHEIAQAEESAGKGKLLSDLVERLAGSGQERVTALMDGIGFHQDIPAALAKRMEHVRMGTIEPEMELADVAKLAEVFPIEFTIIANKIMELTGKGQIAQVKRRPSGAKATSKPA